MFILWGFPIRLLSSINSPRLEILHTGKFSSLNANAIVLSTDELWLPAVFAVPAIATRTEIVVGIIPFKTY